MALVAENSTQHPIFVCRTRQYGSRDNETDLGSKARCIYLHLGVHYEDSSCGSAPRIFGNIILNNTSYSERALLLYHLYRVYGATILVAAGRPSTCTDNFWTEGVLIAYRRKYFGMVRTPTC